MRDNWNVLGIAVNHWHRIHVTLDPQLEPGTLLEVSCTHTYTTTPHTMWVGFVRLLITV
jgi:hypothetical protein